MCNRYIHTTPAGVCMCKYLLHISGVYVCANIYCTYPGLCTYVIRIYVSVTWRHVPVAGSERGQGITGRLAAWGLHTYICTCMCVYMYRYMLICMYVCMYTIHIYYVLISPLPCKLMGFGFFTSRDTYVYMHQYHIFMTVYPNTRNICACSRRVD